MYPIEPINLARNEQHKNFSPSLVIFN